MYLYSKITLIILILTLILQYKRYGIKVLLHPSVFYLIIWILSIVSFEFFLIMNATFLIIKEDILDELFIFISFTSISFIFWGLRSQKKIKQKVVRIQLFIPYNFFKYLSIAFFITSLINLLSVGFNVAENRAIYVSNNFDFYIKGGRLSIWQIIIGVISTLNLPFTIYSGWIIIKNFISRNRKINLIYFLPLASTVLNVVSSGGRAGMFSSFSFFVLGLLLGLFTFKVNYRKIIKTILIYGLIVFFSLSLYSTYVSKQRTMQSGYYRVSYFISLIEHQPILKIFGGIFEYLVFHYQGYQWRRVDQSITQLEYGQNTFAFITNYKIPVISQLLDKNLSIQNLFNLKSPDVIGETLYNTSLNFPSPTITATVYFILVKDFGFYGTLAITFIFVGFSQKLYERLFLKNSKGFLAIILFIAVYWLWMNTIFSHHLLSTWFNGIFYSALLIESINYIYYNKKSHENNRYNNLLGGKLNRLV